MTNAVPSLFRDGEASAQRLRRYLAGEETDVCHWASVNWSHCIIISLC